MNENVGPRAEFELDAARLTLISPPPEEELNHVFRTNNSTSKTKRKRAGAGGTPTKGPVEVTPNPRARKSTRRRSGTAEQLESPTRQTFNPNADWVPHSIPRRSATPYEPPKDVFTPPREVILRTPVQVQPKPKPKPRAGSILKTTPLRVVVHSVKKELPPIDLARPMTPPSPTDDPLLLVSSSPIRRVRSAKSSYADEHNPSDDSSAYAPFDWTVGIADAPDVDVPSTDSMDLDAPASFDGPLPLAPTGGWDSDSDEDEGLGELPASATLLPLTSTASQLQPHAHTPPRHPRPSADPTTDAQQPLTSLPLLVPTKPDPPTPRTLARAAAWGVWGSPWPGRGPADGDASFRMDGRRVAASTSTSDAADAVGAVEGEGADGSGAFDFSASSSLSLSGSQEHHGDEEEEEELEEGVSILRALREEDAARAAVHMDEEQGERQEQEEEEEEEVRAMSVDVDSDAEDGRPRPLPGHDEEEDEEREMRIHSPAPQRGHNGLALGVFSQTQHSATPMHAQTPPTRRAPLVPPRSERGIAATASNSAGARERVRGREAGDGHEDVRMADARQHPQDRDRARQDPDADAEHEQEQERRVLTARGTRPPSTTSRPSSPVKLSAGHASSGLAVAPFPLTLDRGASGGRRRTVGGGEVGVHVDEGVGGEVDVDADADADGDDGESDGDESGVLGLVKISSADPRAAARAAAILKQHDYDCFTRLQRPRARRHSFAGVGKASSSASPPSSARPQPAIGMGMQDLTQLRARARAMQAKKGKGKERETTPIRNEKEKPRVVGERVYFPGSPAPVTTAQLLAEAEAEVSVSLSAPVSFPSVSASASVGGESVSTRLPALRVSRRSDSKEDEAEQEQEQAEGSAKLEQAWGKADWKALDACFTDERIAVAARCGLVPNLLGGEFSKTGSVFGTPRDPFSTPVRGDASGSAVMMASADAVDLGAVVGRFVQLYGAKWDVDSLTQRARAIQNKQRAGHVAPPTPTAPTPANAGLGGHRRRASMEMPELTPLGKPARRARLPPPVGRGAPFSALPPTPEPARRRRVPGSLLAPRYSHLLEEAVAVGGSGTSGRREEQGEDEDTSFADTSAEAEPTRDQDSSFEDEQQQDTSFASSDGGDAEMAPATPLREREALLERPATSHPPAPATIGKRVKGFLFSYLPTLSKTAPPAPASRAGLPARPRLPLPPLELLEKPRGPIKTPVRPPLPKARAPKELVSLQPAPPPAKKALPTRRAPRRLVDLNHVEPPPEPEPPRGPRPRTSSGGSVKDLVKNFEALDGARAKGAEVKRVRSVGDFGNKRPGAGTGAARPMWRP